MWAVCSVLGLSVEWALSLCVLWAVAADTEAPEEPVLRRKAVVRRNEAELLPEAREL